MTLTLKGKLITFDFKETHWVKYRTENLKKTQNNWKSIARKAHEFTFMRLDFIYNKIPFFQTQINF